MLFISLRYSSPILFSLIIPCLILAGYSRADAAFRFGGGAYSIGYRTYKMIEDGKLSGDADSLSQRLSLSVANRGNFYNMRNSPYSLLLGYTHQRYSTNIQGSSYSPSANDFRWSGDVAIRQGNTRGLSLYAMSNKTNNSIFTTSATGSRIGVDFPGQIKKELYSEHGISIIKGHERTLKSFLSYYSSNRGYEDKNDKREFSHLSLQRGINWLHLDLEERRISSKGSTEMISIRVGNVSHRAGKKYIPSSFRKGPREWFRLTNWFEISTDLEYSTTKSGASSKASVYRVSFFGRGYRKVWSMFLSPSYRASKKSANTARSLRLPISARYFPARKFELTSNTSYAKSESINKLGTTVSESESIAENLKAIIRPQNWLTMRPAYSIKRGNSNGLSSLSHNLVLDLTARAANVDVSLKSSYGTSSSENTAGNDSKSDNFNIKANVRYGRFAWVRSMGLSHQYATASNNSGDRKVLNLSQFSLQAAPSYRFNVNFLALHSVADEDGSKSESTKGNATLTYDTKKRFLNVMLIDIEKSNDSKLTRLKNKATYKFTKTLRSKTDIDTIKNSGEFGDTKQLTFSQSIYYSHFDGGFLGRKSYDLWGSYSFNKSDSYGGQDRKSSGYSVAINYYPSRISTLGGSYSYNSDNASNIRTKTKVYANMYYPKFKAGISYSSESNKKGGAGEKIVEKIDFSLTKYF